MAAQGTNPEVHPDLIALLYDLYSAIPEAVRATVLSMPNMNPGAVRTQNTGRTSRAGFWPGP